MLNKCRQQKMQLVGKYRGEKVMAAEATGDLRQEFDRSTCLEHDLLLVALLEFQVVTKNEAKHDKKAAGNSRMTQGCGAAQEFDAVQEWAERCQLCRCRVRWLEIKQKLGRKRSQGRTGELVLCGGAVWWQIALAQWFC